MWSELRVSSQTSITKLITTMSQPAEPPYSPPIAKVFPFIYSTFSFILTAIPITIHKLFTLFTPLLSLIFAFTPLLWILLYAISPLIAFLQLIHHFFIYTPIATAAYLFDALRPVYVFCGVAVIMSCLIGFAGRIVSLILTEWVTTQMISIREDSSKKRKVFIVFPLFLLTSRSRFFCYILLTSPCQQIHHIYTGPETIRSNLHSGRFY